MRTRHKLAIGRRGRNASTAGWRGARLSLRSVSCWLMLAGASTAAAEPTLGDIVYAERESQTLLLDLYQPTGGSGRAPWIVWVHGGAWRSGSKDSVPILALGEQGFAIASIDYRLSPVAPFPAQVEDIQAAIRFLLARADEYGLDPDRGVLAGASAGGHLAALVGVLPGDTLGGSEQPEPLGDQQAGVDEGELPGGNPAPRVQAIVSFYGASNLQTILAQSTPRGLGVRIPALQLLLRGQPDERPQLARAASPVFHVDPSDPPLLLIHGDQDPQMPVNQSLELYGAYQRAGVPVQLHIVHGGAHGGDEFYDSTRLAVVADFLKTQLARAAPTDVGE